MSATILEAKKAQRFRAKLIEEYFLYKLLHFVIMNHNRFNEHDKQALIGAAIADLNGLGELPFERVTEATIQGYTQKIWNNFVEQGFANENSLIEPIPVDLNPIWKFFDEFCRLITIFIYKLLTGLDVHRDPRKGEDSGHARAFETIEEILNSK